MRFYIAILVTVCILALAATIGTIIVGTRSFEGIVVDKPYEQGLAWDETERQKAKRGWKVDVEGMRFRTGENELIIDAVDRSGKPLANAVVTATVSRPSTRDLDKTYAAVQQESGRYRALVVLPLYGAWDITIDVSRDSDRGVYRNSVYAELASGGGTAGTSAGTKTLCNVQAGPCRGQTGDGLSVEFDIAPKPVAAMSDHSFAVTLTLGGKPATDVSSVMLDLSMPGMFMGKNQPAMRSAGAGRYEGKGVIIRCASGKKTWQAEVTVKRPKRTDVVDFVFEVN
ncbi:MAG TPA: FixH family protein [Nitrospirota bacterium]|nr:FixH family protein [Nitrospirota bacterium]